MVIDSTLIPNRFKVALDRYVVLCQRPGGFLTAVLSNDLTGSITRADEEALVALPHIVAYCYNRLPSNCWGSSKAVEAWLSAEKPGQLDNS